MDLMSFTLSSVIGYGAEAQMIGLLLATIALLSILAVLRIVKGGGLVVILALLAVLAAMSRVRLELAFEIGQWAASLPLVAWLGVPVVLLISYLNKNLV